MKHSVYFLKVYNMEVVDVTPTPINGQITDIVKVGDNIANATKKLLDADYKLEHVIPFRDSNNNNNADSHKYIFIKKLENKKCKCKSDSCT